VGSKDFKGVSKTTPEQLDLFTALEIRTPK